jgi:hypothetical protein
MPRLSVVSWIGNAAAVLCGCRGSVTRRAQEAGCSRQTVYEHASRVASALADHLSAGPSREELLRIVEQLRRENAELWEALEQAIDFPREKQQEFLATAAGMGLSLSQILVLLAVILPASECPSRSKLGRWLEAWCTRAREVLHVLDRACRELVLTLCIDEIYLGRRPVLVGVEPHSMAWIIGQKAEDCSGPTWYESLRDWDRLEYVVADAGSGLRKGLSLIQEARSQEAKNSQEGESPQEAEEERPLEVGLDVFHIKKEALPIIHRLWQKAESLWAKAEQDEREVERRKKQGQDSRGKASHLLGAWRKAEEAFYEAERVEAAWCRAEQALNVFRLDGSLNDRAWAEGEITAVLGVLRGGEWAKVRRMLSDPCALTFLDRMHRELKEAEADEALREALVRLWWFRRQRARQETAKPGSPPAAHVVQTVVCERMDPNWRDSFRRVGRVLRQTVRASSVVECMNSVIRMHQARHRTLTQPLLDLKRLYWNCRPFREGKRRGRSPYEHLQLKLPSHRFWELLNADPKELAQALSTTELPS